MLKFLQIILSITVISLAGCGLIIKDFKFESYMMFFLGLTMLVIGLREFQKGQKGNGRLFIGVSIFILFVVISSFLLNNFI